MTDMVNHPPHHKVGGIETIDIIIAQGFGKSYCAGNVIKYILRYQHKGEPLQDLKKCEWYLKKLIELKEKEEAEWSSPL